MLRKLHFSKSIKLFIFIVIMKAQQVQNIIYVITELGIKELQFAAGTIIRLHPNVPINKRHWERVSLFDTVEEKIDRLDSDVVIKRNTRWISNEVNNPIIATTFGNYINKSCHNLPSYELNSFYDLLTNKTINNHE